MRTESESCSDEPAFNRCEELFPSRICGKTDEFIAWAADRQQQNKKISRRIITTEPEVGFNPSYNPYTE